MSFTTTHNLSFEVAPYGISHALNAVWPDSDDTIFDAFRVGTCEGLWSATENTYDILAIINNSPGNGHLEDVFEWFEHSCQRDERDLRVLHCHSRFWKYLIEKRGFWAINEEDVTKSFKQSI